MSGDKLTFFSAKGKGEAIKFIYALAGEKLNVETLTKAEWTPERKAATPGHLLPVLETAEGYIFQSAAICRYSAKKLGLRGCNDWEEVRNDMTMCVCDDATSINLTIYSWKVYGNPEPADSEDIMKKARTGWLQALNVIQSLASKTEGPFVNGAKPQLGDIYLYAALEFSGIAVPDVMSLTDWVKNFKTAFEAEERIKNYIANRPQYLIPY